MKYTENIPGTKLTLGLSALLLSLSLAFPNIVRAGACQTGAEALANVHVRYTPIFAYYFGTIEDYVQQNRSHFVAGGDAVVCAQRLAQVLGNSAVQTYNQEDRAARDRLNAELDAMGISPSQQSTSPSQQLYNMARQMDKLAYALPFAANGDFGPLWAPRDELEQMQIFSMQMFNILMQDPTLHALLDSMKPTIVELADIEYRMILNISSGL